MASLTIKLLSPLSLVGFSRCSTNFSILLTNTSFVAISGVIGLVVLFVLVTTCLRRRRERKFDRDVAEAAAAAAAATADPFFEDEEERGGAHWDPRRASAQTAGYGKVSPEFLGLDPFLSDRSFQIGEDPYAYAAAGVVGGGAFGRNGTNQYQQRNPQDAYSMNDMHSSGHPSSGYSNYAPAGNSYYADPQVDYSRPSFGSNVPGIAGVGSGGGAPQQYPQENQNLRYRGQQQQQQQNNFGASASSDTCNNLTSISFTGGVEDAYGGYTTAGASSSEGGGYPNPYAPSSTAYSQSPARRSTAASPPLPAIPPSQSPPPPPSYTGHGTGRPEKARPMSASQNTMPMPPPNQQSPGGLGTPDESYNDGGRILRVANE